MTETSTTTASIPEPTPVRAPAPHGRRGLVLRYAAGVVLMVLATYGPFAAAWAFPKLLSPDRGRTFSHRGVDLDVRESSLALARFGVERVEATVVRGTQAIYQPTESRGDKRLADRALEVDVQLVGPREGDPFSRGGFILHRHRLGWPLACVEAEIGQVWTAGTSHVGSARGAVIIESADLRPPVRGYWTIPCGVLPVGVAINLAFWIGIAAGPAMVRNGIIARRRRLGRCTGCGYDLSGTRGGPCPECGAARG